MNMTKHRTWALALLAFLAVFLLANFVIWKSFTADMLNAGEYVTPDLVRLSYLSGSTIRRKAGCTLPKQHIESAQFSGQRVDVLTVGDSFSNKKEVGPNQLYQDWLATERSLTVMNARPLGGLDEVETVIALLNSGYLDRVRPRAVILETAERYCIGRYAGDLDFGLTRPRRELEAEYGKPEAEPGLPVPGFVNMSNVKFLANSVLYKFSANAFFSQVYAKDLVAPFFSVPRDRRLLFFREELSSIPFATEHSVGLLNENLNELAQRLKKKGITLYFMPAANKYTIYSGYLADPAHPKSVFFELLRGLPKRYVFVDTKAILQEEVKKGEKDVYYPDDTHWSWKAAKKIAESMKF